MSNDSDADGMWVGFADAVVRLDWRGEELLLAPAPEGVTGVFPAEQPVHIVTAYNPAGLELDATANHERHRELGEAVRGIEVVATVGSARDGSLPEPGYGLLGVVLDDALALGRRFGQRAIYRWTTEELLVIGVDEPVRLRLGWTLTTT